MLLGEVIGTVVASAKVEKLEGLNFLVLKTLDFECKPTGAYVVAADVVHAGIGELVLYATGSSARQTARTQNLPCDAIIMGIVDTWEIGGKVKYQKIEADRAR